MGTSNNQSKSAKHLLNLNYSKKVKTINFSVGTPTTKPLDINKATKPKPQPQSQPHNP